MKKISILMVGTGGYAGVYLKTLLHTPVGEQFEIAGAVDPYAGGSEYGRELMGKGVPVFDTVEEFYREHTARLAIIVTPIYLHARQAVTCMEHGSDVLCEKPICASLQDAEDLIAVRSRTGRRLGIGFQWSFSEGIQKVKRDILDGVYGKVRRIRTIVCFPRDLEYFRRGTGWAGKRRLENGEPVLDSVASNAAAHYLHNMLFLTGEQPDRSARLLSMDAEVYRANPIEMFDTCALRIFTADGTELLFYATHAVPKEEERMPEFVMEGEKGQVIMSYEKGRESLTGRLEDGSTIHYKEPGAEGMRKLTYMAEAVRENAPIPCGPEAVLPHLKCICALAESFPETPVFPREYVEYGEAAEQYTCKGLGEVLDRCWREGKLPYEEAVPWAGEPHHILFG